MTDRAAPQSAEAAPVFYGTSGNTSYTSNVSYGSGGCCGDSDYGDDGYAGTTHEEQSPYTVSLTIGPQTTI